MSTEQVRTARKNELLIVTLANPDGNRMNRAVLRGLQEALTQAGKPDVRAVLVRAEGAVFSLGADVQEMLSQPGDAMLSVIREYIELIQAIEALPLPTIAAVHGVCSSGGLEFALAFDHLWAAAGTKIGFLEPLLAIFPLAGGAQRVASRAGRTRAFEIATAGALYDVETFEKWNIVNRVLAADAFDPVGSWSNKSLRRCEGHTSHLGERGRERCRPDHPRNGRSGHGEQRCDCRNQVVCRKRAEPLAAYFLRNLKERLRTTLAERPSRTGGAIRPDGASPATKRR